jgi:type III pantothenate kinase
MLLAIDIGNSSTKFGIFENENLIKRLTVPTIRNQRADEIYEVLRNKISSEISGVVVSSVVSELKNSIVELSEKYFRQKPFFVGADFDFGFLINYHPPESVGADRLVGAFAAVEKYGKPCLVCDFGTATTIDAVNSRHEYLGGIIAPGLNTLAEALFLKTSRLPHVEIRKTEKVIENTTVGCIQSGIFYGYIGLTEGVISRMIEELSEKPKVIATGGFSRIIAENCPLIEITDENLILDGLRLIFRKIS